MAIGNCPRCGAETDDENELCYQCALRRVHAVLGDVDCDDVSITAIESHPHEKEVCPKCHCDEWQTMFWFNEEVLMCIRCRWIQGD